MQWLIDMVIEFLQTNGYLLPAYIDRGDPADWDYEIGDFTTDGTWRDLDLSGIVPDGAQAVHMRFQIRHPNIGRSVTVRENGNTNTFNARGMQSLIANTLIEFDVVVKCDSDRIIEYNAGAAGAWTNIRTIVKGWIL